MRILFATYNTYLPQSAGGSESSTHDLCEGLMAMGHKVAVVSTLQKFDKTWFANRVKSRLQKRQFPVDHSVGYPCYRGWDLEAAAREIIDDFSPDAVIVQAGRPFAVASWFANLNIPVVLYVRDVEFPKDRAKISLNEYVAFVANSCFTASRLKEYIGADAIVLPPYVNPERYRTETTRKTAVHIGLFPHKGIETSFQLADRRPDIPFVFVESWTLTAKEFKNFEERARQLSNVTIRRRTSDIRKVFSTARVLLVPSEWEEAWGRVVIEAGLNGIPSITSARGGLPEAVGQGGLLVKPEEGLPGWEHALAALWDDPELYQQLSNAAHARSQDERLSREFLLRALVDYVEKHVKYMGEASRHQSY